MNDLTTTVSELAQLIADFVDERDWNQFHSPKNISMSMAIEAAELMEHFQWISTEESREVTQDSAPLRTSRSGSRTPELRRPFLFE